VEIKFRILILHGEIRRASRKKRKKLKCRQLFLMHFIQIDRKKKIRGAQMHFNIMRIITDWNEDDEK